LLPYHHHHYPPHHHGVVQEYSLPWQQQPGGIESHNNNNNNSLFHRRDIVEMLMFCKQKKQITFQQIAECIGRSESWTCAALLGQATFSDSESESLMECLSVDKKLRHSVKTILTQPPMKGALEGKIPVDPVVYRFYEIIQVYGTVFKALIHEKFGDGIMSAADFSLDVDKDRRNDGDYVKVTLCGKFMPYKKW
jgi:cyanate lyase